MAKKRFIFDENYIKRYANKDKMRWLVIGVSALVLIIIIIIVILASKGNKRTPKPNIVPVFEFKEELVLEAGSVLPEAADYFTKLENISIDDIKIEYPNDFEISYDMSTCSEEVSDKVSTLSSYEDIIKYDCVVPILKSPATYGVTLNIQDKEYTVVLKIVDEAAPIIITKNVEIFEEEMYELNDFIQLCYDASSECNISYYDKDVDNNGNPIDYASFTKAGDYTIKIIAKDDYNNVTDPIEAKLTIKAAEAPLYTVIFDSQGGSEVAKVMVQEGGNITMPTTPIKDGYYFVGWYNGDVPFDFKAEVTSDMTLTAKWEVIPDDPIVEPKPPVNPKPPTVVYVNKIYLDFKAINLYVGDSKTVSAVVTPANAVNRTVTWSSSDNSIASVNNGVITGVKAGSVIVTATAGGKSASVTVTVRDKNSQVNPSTCPYGDASYNSSYILSVNLTNNGCAVNPNGAHNETVSGRDYQNMVQSLANAGYDTTTIRYNLDSKKVKNNAGTGVVGYQFTVSISVKDPNSYTLLSAEYIIKPDGSRQFLKNSINGFR